METVMRPDPYQWGSTNRGDQLKELAMAFMRLCTEQGDGDNLKQSYVAPPQDPYARASVAALSRPIHNAMIRHLQPEPALQSGIPRDVRSFRKPAMKRKVLRRTPDGEVQVTDESIISEPESSGPSDPEYRELSRGMYHRDTQEEEEEESEEEECEPNSSSESETSCSGRTTDSQSQSPQSRSQSRSTASYEQDLILPSHQKSFILPRLDQISRNRMKTDRVARYWEHKHDWESLRLPGEDHRKSVRWSIRAQMLYKSEFPPRAQHVYIPNNYLVPTEKKRSALRWGIRCDMANGVMPRSSYSS